MLVHDWEHYDCHFNSDDEFLDADGYPTDLARAVILLWPAADYGNLFKFIKDLWMYADLVWHQSTDSVHNVTKYKISTAGWSGNEDLIATMQDNRLFWLHNWFCTRRGGHYEFEITSF